MCTVFRGNKLMGVGVVLALLFIFLPEGKAVDSCRDGRDPDTIELRLGISMCVIAVLADVDCNFN